jgi:hypothetical protein
MIIKIDIKLLETITITEVNLLNTTNRNKGRKWKEIFSSVDDLFIIFGILLNGASAVVSLIEGHLIAGLILVACEIALIVAYVLKII